ncbi:hypothetical protein [Ferrimicrobium acidiphilum]|uniref:hypothetical protein n=1 Tax=Ferrimicrobium acidiphilum TaxID=121039 RepID=UPI0023F08A4F|nr:hypothetical protein [Ferrimicrobium acidiphilum]
MSISSVRVAGGLLLLLGVVLGFLATANESLVITLFAMLTVVAAITAVVSPERIAFLCVGAAIVCLAAMVATNPPTSDVGLLLLAPLGVVTVLGSLLITSRTSIVDCFNLAEWSILLATGVISVLVVVIAMVTPLAGLSGQLISGVLVVIAIGVLNQLVRSSRDARRQ